jgi:hypothetical protein
VAIEDKKRVEKYQKLVKDIVIDTKQSSHSRQDLKQKQKELKKGWNFDQLEEQDELKRKFAEALFKKS